MKILHVIDSLGFGGAQTVVKGIFEAKKEDKNISLFVLREKNNTIEINHQNVIVFKSEKKYSIKSLGVLRKMIKEEDIDVLHCHLFKAQLIGFFLKIFYFPNIKLVQHEHGKIFENQMFYNRFLKISEKKTDLYLAVSKAIKRKLIEKAKISETKITVLYNFVDLNKFDRESVKWDSQKEREKIGIKESNFVVGFAGRLVELKGWRDFLKAASLILRINHNFKFVIVGDGPQKSEMSELIKYLNIESDILYLGYVPNMVWFYSLLDCFVIPSHWEAMGLTEIEAQAMGVPVIASNVAALNEIIVDKVNGLLFDVRNASSLTRQITLLSENKEIRNILIKNGLISCSSYSLQAYLRRLNNIYGNI